MSKLRGRKIVNKDGMNEMDMKMKNEQAENFNLNHMKNEVFL